MSDTTTIEWATASWSPWEGCTKISEGCAHCYAETRNHRLGMDNWGKGKPRRRTSAAYWKRPLAWERAMHAAQGSAVLQRPRIFPSLCDWLDDEVPIEWLADFLRLIHDTPNLDWLLLTKRPENFESRLLDAWNHITDNEHDPSLYDWLCGWLNLDCRGYRVPANVWPGASVENQRCADERIPQLLRIPATVRFLSVEPLLDVVHFSTGWGQGVYAHLKGIHWVIVGGESGPRARTCDVDWVRSIVRQCQDAGVPCFVKQLGSKPYQSPERDGAAGFEWQLAHPKGGDPAEWPADLQVRQFPHPLTSDLPCL